MFIKYVLLFLIIGCSSVERSTLLGAGSGASLGALSGAYLNPQGRGKPALYSGLAMGFLGGALGYFGHKELEKRDRRTRKKILFELKKNHILTQKEKKQYYNFGKDREVFIITDDPRLLRKLQ